MRKLLFIALAALAGCVGENIGKEPDGNGGAAESLRVAVYVGAGARNVGAYRWLELTARCADIEATPVDGEAVRAGALDSADVLVMPGGSSVDESKSLGPEGREKVKEFVKGGGGYIGTCAGCCLLMESAKGHPDMLHMIPFKFGPASGKAEMSISFNRRAEELAGIKKGATKIRYSEGPVPLPSLPVKDAETEVVAIYNSDLNSKGDKERPSMAGQAAAIAGTYGKGRLFVLSVHPEYDPDDHYVLKGAFRFVTGREFDWELPQRRRNQLVVGFVCDDSFGVDTARLVQKLVSEEEFDVIPLNKQLIASGLLRRVDAVLAPAGERSAKPETGLYGDNAGRTKEFLARGGRIFAWGSAAEAAKERESGVTCVADADAAVAALRAFAAEPLPAAQDLPAKIANPVRAGIFQNPDNSCIPIARMLDLAPEFELKFLAPEDYISGGLDGLDLVIQPGGGCTKQYHALGEQGAEALKRFVLGGGKYYGVCAGAFLALQQSRENYPRLGLLPFKGDDPSHYRGLAPVKVTLTEAGLEAFSGSETNRMVYYAGGPVAVPGDPVEDSDVQVLGKYSGRIINTDQPEPIEEMEGKAAFIGGRVGKGKVFVSCPHPEKDEDTEDLVRSAIRYLTGVAPTPVHLERTRGAITVRYRSTDKTSADFLFKTLNRDSRFYVWAGKDLDNLTHVDAVVLTGEIGKTDVKKLKPFMRRGGRVVVVADTPERRKAAENLNGAVAIDSYSILVDAILE